MAEPSSLDVRLPEQHHSFPSEQIDSFNINLNEEEKGPALMDAARASQRN